MQIIPNTIRYCLISLFSCVIICSQSYADIYRYEDEEGVVHFTEEKKDQKSKLFFKDSSDNSHTNEKTNKDKPINHQRHKKSVFRGEKIEAAAIKQAVLRILKDPYSARFGAIKQFKRKEEYSACVVVNSKNSYGGYVGDKVLLLQKIDNEWMYMGDLASYMCRPH
ncbi:MAG: DUF4124 domain-containing protein [Geobacter sp.]